MCNVLRCYETKCDIVRCFKILCDVLRCCKRLFDVLRHLTSDGQVLEVRCYEMF